MTLKRTSIRYRNGICPHYYLCDYLPWSAGKDLLSLSLLKWKQGQYPDLDVWISCSLEALAGIPIHPGTIIVRALHHHETTLTPQTLADPGPGAAETTSPLDLLGKALASRFQAVYLPGLLTKSSITPEIKDLSRVERIARLQGLYAIDGSLLQGSTYTSPVPPAHTPVFIPRSNARFLLLDDVLTTGTTLKMIISVIRERYPHSSLTAFTLVRSAYDRNLDHPPSTIRKYQPEAGLERLWSEEAEPRYSAGQLTVYILANSF